MMMKVPVYFLKSRKTWRLQSPRRGAAAGGAVLLLEKANKVSIPGFCLSNMSKSIWAFLRSVLFVFFWVDFVLEREIKYSDPRAVDVAKYD